MGNRRLQVNNTVKLTMIGNPEVDDGKPMPCYCLPEMICFWFRGRSSFGKSTFPAVGKFKREVPIEESHWPKQDCTIVWLSNGHQLPVTETPDEVARLRLEALEQTTFRHPGADK